MKKFISLLLAIMLALCPIAALSAKSPTAGSSMVFKSKPPVTFMIPAADKSWRSLKLYKNLDENYKWNLMDVIILKTEESYPDFLCRFAVNLKEDQELGIVLTDLEYNVKYAAMGEQVEDNWLAFDFSDVSPDTYIMFIYISKVD